jgi:hypothetical protein
MTINFFDDVIVPRLPIDLTESELDEIKQMIRKRYYELAAQDRSELMLINSDMVRSTRKEFERSHPIPGATIDDVKAQELGYLEKAPLVYQTLKKVAERTSNVRMLQDLERFKETPDVVLFKYFNMTSWIHQLRQLRNNANDDKSSNPTN